MEAGEALFSPFVFFVAFQGFRSLSGWDILSSFQGVGQPAKQSSVESDFKNGDSTILYGGLALANPYNTVRNESVFF
jgi:hypothetical protein